MTFNINVTQKVYNLTVAAHGFSVTTEFVSSSHTHAAVDIRDSTAVGRALLTAVDAATARAAIGAGTGGGGGVTDGDKGGVIVSGGGLVWSLDYAEINATVAPAWANITGRPTISGTNTGDQTITLTGAVTGSGTGSFATTLGAGAVALANMANMATGSLIYRKTAGSGTPEVQTLATLKADLGLTGTNSGDQTVTLTGDATGSGTGSFAVTLATVNSNVGAFGSASAVATFTVDSKGRTTAAGSTAISIGAAAINDSTGAGRAMLMAASATAQTALLDAFTSGAKGLAPASGGGTTNFLRADGTWAAPPGGGGGVSDGDKGDVVVSGGGAVWSIDYTAVNAAIAPVFANLTAKPTTISGYGISDAVTLTGAQTVAGKKSLSAELGLSGLASDPASPANGDLWYNATETRFKGRAGGVSIPLSSFNSIPHIVPPSGFWYATCFTAVAPTTLAGAADRIEISPFCVRGDLNVTAMACNVTTGVASALGKLVLYDTDATGLPTNVLFESGDLDFSTTGIKQASLSLTLRQGKTYWAGVRHSSTATLSVWPTTSVAYITATNNPSTSARSTARRTVTYATPASAWGAWVGSDIANVNPTAIWFQV